MKPISDLRSDGDDVATSAGHTEGRHVAIRAMAAHERFDAPLGIHANLAAERLEEVCLELEP
ncbi:MAG: hypothetical protein GWP04_06305 [Gammaproteobacteria bacterium]|nr:hypothetical protein [Gammaproteobacteria bacterium]